ncbi:MAG: serine hydrolase domain-containing protein [Nocardioidaceae bacterium]
MRDDTAAALLHDVAESQATWRQPSLVAGVVRDGEFAWWAARGRVTTGDDNPPPDSDLQYRIGSLTKTLVAISVLQCRDEGMLDLDDALAAHVGNVPFGDATIRRLLTHSAGIPAEPNGPWWERHDGGDFDQLRLAVSAQPVALTSGRQHHYSNLGYALLGRLVEHHRRAPWFEVIHDLVLAPLGMTRTTYAPTAPAAHGWSVHPWTRQLDPEPSTDTRAMAPAGQLWSTLRDLGRYAAFLLDPERAPTKILTAKTLAEMRVAQSADPAEGLDGAYGLGLRLIARPGRARYGHTGSMPGFLAGLFVDPDQHTAAVTLSNATTGGTPNLTHTLLDTVEQREPYLPQEWAPEPDVPEAADLLGPWHWGDTPALIEIGAGYARIRFAGQERSTRLEHAGNDCWRGLDGYLTGEPLTVHRDRDGAVTHLELATYRLTRAPYDR